MRVRRLVSRMPPALPTCILRRVGRPDSSYLVCANQRSGSNLLCQVLSDTGVAGHPAEYFLTGPPEAFPPGWQFWERSPLALEHGVTTREEYVDLVYRVGSTPNGVFGAKLMANNMPWVMEKLSEMRAFAGRNRREVLHEVFPRLRVLHLTRRDRVRQAVSWARAAQDGVWLVMDDAEAAAARPAATYQHELIANLQRLIEEGEQQWLDLYAELGVVPHVICYEDLVDEDTFEATVRGALRHLGVDADVSEIPKKRVRKQADEVNEEWARRYVEQLSAG